MEVERPPHTGLGCRHGSWRSLSGKLVDQTLNAPGNQRYHHLKAPSWSNRPRAVGHPSPESDPKQVTAAHRAHTGGLRHATQPSQHGWVAAVTFDRFLGSSGNRLGRCAPPFQTCPEGAALRPD